MQNGQIYITDLTVLHFFIFHFNINFRKIGLNL